MHDWNPQSLSSLTISLSLFLSLPSFNSLLWKPWQSLLQPCMMQSTYTTCIIKGMFNGMAAVDFRPMLWGMKAVETHSVKKSLGASLSKQTTAEEVMECLDQKNLQTSILKLPLRRKMQVRSLWYLYKCMAIAHLLNYVMFIELMKCIMHSVYILYLAQYCVLFV